MKRQCLSSLRRVLALQGRECVGILAERSLNQRQVRWYRRLCFSNACPCIRQGSVSYTHLDVYKRQSPVSISGIVWGKYLALLTIYAIPLVVAMVCPLIMSAFGTVSLLRAYGCLLAFFLLGAATLAIGLFMSSLTENQIIAALCTFGALILIYLMPSIACLLYTSTVCPRRIGDHDPE